MALVEMKFLAQAHPVGYSIVKAKTYSSEEKMHGPLK